MTSDETLGAEVAVGSSTREGVYLRLPKTASTTLESVLDPHPRVLINRRDGFLPRKGLDNHWLEVGLARLWRQALGDDRWRSAFRFAFVRNPYDRMVSCWKFVLRRLERGELGNSLGPDAADRYRRHGGALPFSEFVELLDTGEIVGGALWHATPQARHLLDAEGRLDVDLVGRFERLQEDFARVARTLDLPAAALPHLNRSQRRAYAEYYTPELRRIVARRYAEDLERFEYRFDADDASRRVGDGHG